MNFATYFKEQIQVHPSMQPTDAAKLCYQAAFGAEHLLLDIEPAKNYMTDEFSSVPAACEKPLFEQISPDFCRVNLAAWKAQNIPCEWLFELFRITASNGAASDGQDIFLSCIRIIDTFAASGDLPFNFIEWCDFKAQYDIHAPRPVHHSAIYREHEYPAYRVVSMRLAELIPLLMRMSELSQNDAPNVLAIDGRAAAGKTTSAAILAEITGAEVIHMDDFFLPGKLRTEKRISEPGGNVHYERFLAEVIPHLLNGDAFDYQMFDCAEMRFGDTRYIRKAPWRIVEGSYSCHPNFKKYYTFSVFCDIAPEDQIQRILRRDGSEIASVFSSRWIPMEELYFDVYRVRDAADIIFHF